MLGVGTWLAANGRMTLGELLAFLFLVNLFTMPVQQETEILNELQNAVAGWRRVIEIIDTAADVADPGPAGRELARGPVDVRLERVRFAYPGGPDVIHDVDLTIPARHSIAIVGETGSGKSTIAKLVTRLMDPTQGRVLLDGVDLRDIRFSSLRERVVLVPQEGFLLDVTLAANVRLGTPEASDAQIRATVDDLGLGDSVSYTHLRAHET